MKAFEDAMYALECRLYLHGVAREAKELFRGDKEAAESAYFSEVAASEYGGELTTSEAE